MDGDGVAEVVELFGNDGVVGNFGEGAEGVDDGLGVDAGAADFEKLVFAGDDGAEARGGAAAGAGVGVEGGEVAGAEAEEREALDTERRDDHFADGAGRERVAGVVEDFDCGHLGIEVAALAEWAFGEGGASFGGGVGGHDGGGKGGGDALAEGVVIERGGTDRLADGDDAIYLGAEAVEAVNAAQKGGDGDDVAGAGAGEEFGDGVGLGDLLGSDADAGGAELLGAEPVGEAGDEEAIHADGQEEGCTGADAGDGKGDGFVGGEAMQVGGGEGDVKGFAGGAGSADPFADFGAVAGVEGIAGGGELVFGGQGKIAKGRGGIDGVEGVAVEGAGAGVGQMGGEFLRLQGLPARGIPEEMLAGEPANSGDGGGELRNGGWIHGASVKVSVSR